MYRCLFSSSSSSSTLIYGPHLKITHPIFFPLYHWLNAFVLCVSATFCSTTPLEFHFMQFWKMIKYFFKLTQHNTAQHTMNDKTLGMFSGLNIIIIIMHRKVNIECNYQYVCVCASVPRTQYYRERKNLAKKFFS